MSSFLEHFVKDVGHFVKEIKHFVKNVGHFIQESEHFGNEILLPDITSEGLEGGGGSGIL